MSDPDERFTVEDFTLGLLPYIFERNSEAVLEWLHEHAESYMATAQLIETLPRCTAILLRRDAELHGIETPISGESFFALRIQGKGDPPPHVAYVGQLITAALNDDDDGITGLVAGILEWPDAVVAEVVGGLIMMLADASDMLLPERPDEDAR